jgi:hypothetical protein
VIPSDCDAESGAPAISPAIIAPAPIPTDPDLARIIEAWPGLSAAIRASLAAMATAASGGGR